MVGISVWLLFPYASPVIRLQPDIVTVCLISRIIMATGSPMMNGDVPHAASQPGTLEETLQLMNILIQENRDLKGKSQGLLVCTGV